MSEAIEQAFDHVLRVSFSLPDEAFEDLPARWTMLYRGLPVAEALSGWPPIEALNRIMAEVGAVAGFISLDISIVGRPHFYGDVIVPKHVTPEDLDRRWSEETGAHEDGRLEDRVCELRSWPHLIALRKALATGFVTDEARAALAKLRGLLSDDVRHTVSYALKGGDRSSFKHRMYATAPKAIHSRPAHEWIVWSRGLSSTAGLGLASRSISTAEASAVRDACIDARLEREHTCACCGGVLSMVRHAGPEDEVPAAVRVPRIDRQFCSHACAATSSRAHLRVLTLLGRAMRREREARIPPPSAADDAACLEVGAEVFDANTNGAADACSDELAARDGSMDGAPAAADDVRDLVHREQLRRYGLTGRDHG